MAAPRRSSFRTRHAGQGALAALLACVSLVLLVVLGCAPTPILPEEVDAQSRDGGPGTGETVRCGNGVAQGSEVCDGTDLRQKTCVSIGQGFTGGVLACRGDCQGHVISGCTKKTAACGNGSLDQGEECDNGKANSDTLANACRTNCTKARCGDAVKDSGEDCDDGNKVSYDGCATDCTGRKYPPAPADTVCVGTGQPSTDKCTSCAGYKLCLRVILLGVSNGSVVRVGPGTYSTIVQLFDKHNLIIEGAKGARIAPASALEVFHVGGPMEGKNPCSNITIRGFEIYSPKSGHGIWLEEASGTKVLHNVIHLGTSGTNQSLVLGDEGSNNVIANNDLYFDSNSKKGVGIWLLGSSSGQEKGDQIYGNRISTVTVGIEVSKGCSAKIWSNIFGANVGQPTLCPGTCT